MIFLGLSLEVLRNLDFVELRAQRLIQPLEPGQTGLPDGTAIGTGLATAVNLLRGSTARSKVIVLATDGQNNTGDIAPLDAAQIALRRGREAGFDDIHAERVELASQSQLAFR